MLLLHETHIIRTVFGLFRIYCGCVVLLVSSFQMSDMHRYTVENMSIIFRETVSFCSRLRTMKLICIIRTMPQMITLKIQAIMKKCWNTFSFKNIIYSL